MLEGLPGDAIILWKVMRTKQRSKSRVLKDGFARKGRLGELCEGPWVILYVLLILIY
jgi:hypothetical protein